MDRRWLAVGSAYGFLAVALGAFGAHALKARLTPEMLGVWHTGVEYQFMHALALLWLARGAAERMQQYAGWCFALGVPLFSGSLYALALTDVKMLGAVTPLGGLLFLAGWAQLFFSAIKKPM